MDSSGIIIFLDEISLGLVGKTARVTGFLTLYDCASRRLVITYENSSLEIDMSLAELPQGISEGHLCQFIGDVRSKSSISEVSSPSNDSQLFLLAKIACSVDGLDMKLYREAVLRRRLLFD
jgi:Telomere-capping, CST complex subunit